MNASTFRPAARLLGAIVVLLLVAATSACGLRLEGPAQAEPTPDTAETLRAAVVADVTTITALAQSASVRAGVDADHNQFLQQLITLGDDQLAALGGVYDSGLNTATDDDGTPEPAASVSPGSDETPQELLDALVTAANRTAAALVSVDDPGIARLYAAISVRQRVDAAGWAQLTGLSPTTAPATVPGTPQASEAAASQTPQAEASATAEATAPPVIAGVTEIDLLATALPPAITAEQLSDLVALEDSIGFMYELRAARTGTETRGPDVAAAAQARAIAQHWAEAGGIAETPSDPRQVFYTFPDGIPADTAGIDALIAQARVSEGTIAMTAVTDAAAEDRQLLTLLAGQFFVTAQSLGATITPFPGLVDVG